MTEVASTKKTSTKKASKLSPMEVVTRIGAVLVIIILIAADIFALRQMFIQSHSTPFNANVFGALFGIITSGVPIIMGWCLAAWLDKTRYKKNDERNSIIGLSVGTIILLAVFVLIFFVRFEMIHSSGLSIRLDFEISDYDYYLFSDWRRVPRIYTDAEGNTSLEIYYFRSGWNRVYREAYRGTPARFGFDNTFSINLFLMFSPVLTSLFAFVISWHIFRKDNIDKLEKEVEGLYEKFIKELEHYKNTSADLDNKKLELWSMFNSKKSMPSSMHSFRKKCFKMVRSMIMGNSAFLYKRQLERFMHEMEGDIATYISKISDKSNVAHRITEELTIADIIDEFDKKLNPEKKWDSDKAFDTLQNEFANLLNIIADIENMKVKKHKKEEDPGS